MSHAPLPPFETAGICSKLPDRVLQGLLHLHEAHTFAEQFGKEVWQYGVELQTLLHLGMTFTDCRWLVDSQLAEAARETTEPGCAVRSFERMEGTRYPVDTCFALTRDGAIFVSQLLAPNSALANSNVDKKYLPQWDADRRELYFGPVLVKRFKLPAPNQERILLAFSEDGWPRRIDDPLPPKSGHDPKRRLHDTINSLNRNRLVEHLHFRGDGTGRGICWDVTVSPLASPGRDPTNSSQPHSRAS